MQFRECVDLEVLPIGCRRNRAITVCAQQAHAGVFVTLQDCLRRMSKRVRFAHGDHGDSWRDGREKWFGRRRLAPMVRNLKELSRERCMPAHQR